MPAVVGAILVLLVDTVGARASRRFAFDYRWLQPVSLLIYVLTGLLAYLSDGGLSPWLSGYIVGLVDGSLGWACSARIGPGRLTEPRPTGFALGMRLILTCLFVASLGGVGGLVGGWLGSWLA
jgi:hypothetical protein